MGLGVLAMHWSPLDEQRAMLVPVLLAVGFAYGANWAIMPSSLKVRFGGDNLGVLFNLHASALAIAVAIVSSKIGKLYDDSAAKAAAEQGLDASHFCTGESCFHGAWIVAGVL